MRLPETLEGCQRLLELTQAQLKQLKAQEIALFDLIAKKSKGGSGRTPARAASAKGGAVTEGESEA